MFLVCRVFTAIVAALFFNAPLFAQSNTWLLFTNGGPKATNCPVISEQFRFCFVASCTAGNGLIGVFQNGGPPVTQPAELRVTVDGRFSYIIALEDASVPGQGRYGAPLYAGEASRLLDALISGSYATLSLASETGTIRHDISLRGSARALRPVLQACPNRNLQLDPSDVPVGNRPAPASQPTVFDKLDLMFQRQGCTATETQVYDTLRDGQSIGDGQVRMLNWSKSPTWNENYEIVSRDPFIYRMKSGPCAQAPKAEPVRPATYTEKATEKVQAMLTRACQSRGGQLEQAGLITEDLSGDGIADLLLDEGYITCNGTTPQHRRSISCGTQVCEMHIFLWQNNAFTQVANWQNGFGGLVEGTPPGIKIISHGGQTGIHAWNGQGFSPMQ